MCEEGDQPGTVPELTEDPANSDTAAIAVRGRLVSLPWTMVDVQRRGGGLPRAEDVKSISGALCGCHKLQANDMATRRRACVSGRPEMAKKGGASQAVRSDNR
jgi:hypothetical protein